LWLIHGHVANVIPLVAVPCEMANSAATMVGAGQLLGMLSIHPCPWGHWVKGQVQMEAWPGTQRSVRREGLAWHIRGQRDCMPGCRRMEGLVGKTIMVETPCHAVTSPWGCHQQGNRTRTYQSVLDHGGEPMTMLILVPRDVNEVIKTHCKHPLSVCPGSSSGRLLYASLHSERINVTRPIILVVAFGTVQEAGV
jgi:hypothetical protein